MRFKNLDLNLLVALDHLLELRSITLAAKRMNMSQSAMSNALIRLRDYFDDQILVQVGRQMKLTSLAEAMKQPVRDILVRIDATISINPVFQPERSDREFRLLISDYTMSVLIPHLLELIYQQSSTIKIKLLPQIQNPHTALEQGNADFLVAPTDLCSINHPSEPLFEDQFKCVVWNKSKFADKKITKKDYISAGHVRMQPSGGDANSFETLLLRLLDVERNIDVTTYNFTSLCSLVIGSDRIATVHSLLINRVMEHDNIVVHDLPFNIKKIGQSLQWHEYKSHDPGILWLKELFHKAVENMYVKENTHL